MLRLKEVVDRQRDELRAQAHEIVCKSRDTEAVRVWELGGVLCQGPRGAAFMSHPPSPGLSQLLSLLGQVAPMSLGGDTASPLAALGPPAAGTAPTLHGHERGAAAQGGRGAGPAQECSGAEVRPGGCHAAKPEGHEQEEQDSSGEPAARACCGESELWPRCCWASPALTPHSQPGVQLLVRADTATQGNPAAGN